MAFAWPNRFAEVTQFPERFQKLFTPWTIAAAILLVWGQSLAFDFVWDDRPFILENDAVQSVAKWPEMFWRLDAQSSMPEGFVLFRPLRTLHYGLLFLLGGAQFQPAIFHGANLAWHFAASLLLFRFLKLLFGREGRGDSSVGVAWLAAVAFAVHPVVSEVVCWIKSLDDLMATTFVLASSVALLERRMGLSLLWYGLALYSKESAAPLLFSHFLLLLWWSNRSPQTAVRTLIPFAAAAFVFVVHRHLVIGRTSQTAPISGSYGQTLLDTLQVVPEYFRLLFGAPPFIADYTFQQSGFTLGSPIILLGMALLLAMIAFTVWLARTEHKLAAFGFAWTGFYLLPVSNLLPMMQYMAERFLYLPLVGWLMAMAALWFRLSTTRFEVRATAFAVVLVCWASLAAVRAGAWRDEIALFGGEYQRGYASRRVEQNAIAAAFSQAPVRAVFDFNQTTRKARLRKPPTTIEALLAIQALNSAVETIPPSADVAAALGILHVTRGEMKQAVAQFRAATKLRPNDPSLWANLGQAFIDARQFGDASKALQRAFALDPHHLEAWRSKSQMEWLQGDYAEAVATLKKLQELEPNNPAHREWIAEGEKLLSNTNQVERR